MKSVYMTFALFVLIAGLLTACGAQPVEAPPSAPTEDAAPATDTSAPTEAPVTETPATEVTAATQPPVQGDTVSFASDVMPIVESRCINCHGGERTQEGLSLKSHAELMAGSDNGTVVVPGDAANSLLVELVAEQKMPKRGPKLTPPQVQLITDWVNQGALDN
jgi:uncharacterized membrane protein